MIDFKKICDIIKLQKGEGNSPNRKGKYYVGNDLQNPRFYWLGYRGRPGYVVRCYVRKARQNLRADVERLPRGRS